MIYSFPPIIGEDSRLLILGSMPSVVSLERQQYYGHKQNYFWPMLFQLLEEPYSEVYEEKKSLLLRHHIALWDVLASCEREGSLDSNILKEVPNDLPGLLTQHPSIGALVFNGGKAYQVFRRNFPAWLDRLPWYQMPSTSPAHTMPREEKRRQWQQILTLCEEKR